MRYQNANIVNTMKGKLNFSSFTNYCHFEKLVHFLYPGVSSFRFF